MTHPNKAKKQGIFIDCPPNVLLILPPKFTRSFKTKYSSKQVLSRFWKGIHVCLVPLYILLSTKHRNRQNQVWENQVWARLKTQERPSTATLSCLNACSEVTWVRQELSWQCIKRLQAHKRKHGECTRSGLFRRASGDNMICHVWKHFPFSNA